MTSTPTAIQWEIVFGPTPEQGIDYSGVYFGETVNDPFPEEIEYIIEQAARIYDRKSDYPIGDTEETVWYRKVGTEEWSKAVIWSELTRTFYASLNE